MRFVGIVYRAHNPRWSFAPLSGAGAAIHGGRFNRPGRDALYLSLSIETAIREAAQGFAGKLDPLTIVSYEADIDNVIDLSSVEEPAILGISDETLSNPWMLKSARKENVPSWNLAERLIFEGVAGILVPSFSRGARDNDINLVLWNWGPDLPHRITVHDPQQRLPKDQSSWTEREQ